MPTNAKKASSVTPARISKAFAKVLRELRKEKGFSQEGLGFESGLHRTYVSQIERAEKQPTINTLFKLAAALECEPHTLIQRVEEKLG